MRSVYHKTSDLSSVLNVLRVIQQALFIHSFDGKEPPQYRKDGLGNADHIGWYTGGRYEVVHSSSSRGGVYPSTLRNGWTHVGWLKALAYEWSDSATLNPVDYNALKNEVLPMNKVGYINLPADENVFLRISPDKKSAWFGRINGGEQVEVVSANGTWTRVKYGEHDGYVASSFVSLSPPPIVSTPENPILFPSQAIDASALLLEQESLLLRLMAINKALKGAG